MHEKTGTPRPIAKRNPRRDSYLPRAAARSPFSKLLQPAAAAAIALAAFTLHAQNPTDPTAPAPSPSGLKPQASSLPLENLRQLSETLYSGGEPVGDVAFSKLAELGVRTVVSVDGARPNLDLAKKHGLRYVHIPIGYDAVDPEAQAALTRVVREIKGPVFLHCHHGKHRGPAAAAIMCMAADNMTHAEALDFLKAVGTGAEYEGLWRDVREFQALAADAELPELVEVAEVDSLAAAMAVMDRAWDGVKLVQAAGWKTPPGHADIAPAHQALLVWEGLREARRTLDGNDATLAAWMDESIAAADVLHKTLEANRTDDAAAAYKKLEATCAKCHAAYRN